MSMPGSHELNHSSLAPRSSYMPSSSSHSPAPQSLGHSYPANVPQFIPGPRHSSLSYILSNDAEVPTAHTPMPPYSSACAPTAPPSAKTKHCRKRASNVHNSNTIPNTSHDIITAANSNINYSNYTNTATTYNNISINGQSSTDSRNHHDHTQKATIKKVRSSKCNVPGTSRYWTPSEHKKFIQAIIQYGPKDLKAISEYVGTRNMIQCRTHAQKCFMRLMREAQRITYIVNNKSQSQDESTNANAHPSLSREDKTNDGASTSNKSQHHSNRRTGTPLQKIQKDVYSVPRLCGIPLLCAVTEEMSRSLR